jgi:hypothetical protein
MPKISTGIAALLLLMLSACANIVVQDIEQIERLSSQKKCQESESIARQNFFGSDLLTVLSVIEIDCKSNVKEGIRLLKAAAIEGNQKAIQVLVGLGETLPEPAAQLIIQQQQQRRQQLTIRQPQAQQQPKGTNLDSCIHDRGSLYCPNYPNTGR